MNENYTFYEKQSFRQWWIWALLIFVLAYSIYNSFENHDYFSASELIFSIAVPILIMILIFVIKLETKIDILGIRVRLFPFHFQFKYFPWKNIQKVYIREYSPITEYGGWGLRFGMFGKGKAYNISGNLGIQIVFKDQKKLLIGTQKSVEMKQFLEELEKV
ncbi:hypothetical protein NZ698_16440 [Chryseobacterium sp. PBS4-4]|uniref:PH domain-containing protein n=1 Tax=Chryseobacterium edaphi TaxID=2976532 RepID=A0ABT2WDU0_9FLAO|nr:hypothetical protein [Chryseobacterium edaphi]MCU7618785.1 hypothetical protein [Chryseobacterium edaphi]